MPRRSHNVTVQDVLGRWKQVTLDVRLFLGMDDDGPCPLTDEARDHTYAIVEAERVVQNLIEKDCLENET